MAGIAFVKFPDLEDGAELYVGAEIWFGSKQEFITEMERRDRRDDGGRSSFGVELLHWFEFPNNDTDTGPFITSDVTRAFEVLMALWRYDGGEPFQGFKAAMEWLLGEVFLLGARTARITR